VSRYQKGKTNLNFTEARDSEWQWHQLGHMQVCISLQTDNHASTPPLFFTGRIVILLVIIFLSPSPLWPVGASQTNSMQHQQPAAVLSLVH